MSETGQHRGEDFSHALTDDQRKHLDFIQAVIARLASSSAAAKGWGLSVATFVFGFSVTQAAPAVAVLGVVVVTSFARAIVKTCGLACHATC